jgi:hypothetical protein
VTDDPEPILGDEFDDETPWGRFAGGLPMEGDRGDSGVVVWDVFALGLAAAAALLFLGSIVQAFSFFGVSMRDRAFVASVDGSSALTAGLAAAAVVIETAVGEPWRRRLGRWAVASASVTSAAVLASAAYVIAYLALVHPHLGSPDFSVAMLRAAQAAASWSVRLEGMLGAAAAGVLAGATIYIVRHAALTPTRGSTPDELSAS